MASAPINLLLGVVAIFQLVEYCVAQFRAIQRLRLDAFGVDIDAEAA